MKKIVIVFLFLPLVMGAQMITSEGEMPSEMSQDLLEVFKIKSKEIYNNNIEKPRLERVSEVEFYKNSTYYLDQMYSSGRMVFGTEMNKYVNDVLQVVLKGSPEMKDNINIFIIRSYAVNAFATDNGMLFVTTALLARLHNEAELAFILGHEISHYREKHGLNKYTHKRKLEEGQAKDVKSKDALEGFLNVHSYSRDLETEADEFGLELFLQTGYGVNAIKDVYDVLEFSANPYKPYAMLQLEDFTYFKDTIPAELILEQIDTLVAAEEKDDAFSTHPSIHKRREWLKGILESNKNNSSQEFIVSKEKFFKTQKECILEQSYQYLISGLYIDALVNTHLARQEFSEYSAAFDWIELKALYGLSLSYEYGYRPEKINKSYAGPVQRIESFFINLDVGDISLMTYLRATELFQKTQDSAYREMALYTMDNMVYRGQLGDWGVEVAGDRFSKQKKYISKGFHKNIDPKEKPTPTKPNTKKFKPKYSEFLERTKAYLLASTSFKEDMDLALVTAINKRKQKIYEANNPNLIKKKGLTPEDVPVERNYLFSTPQAVIYNLRDNVPYDPLRNEKFKRMTLEACNKSSELFNVNSTILDLGEAGLTVRDYNKICIINDLLLEYNSLPNGDFDYIPLRKNEATSLQETYKTDHLILPLVYEIATPRRLKFLYYMVSAYPPFIPRAVRGLFTPHYTTGVSYVFFNFKEGKVKASYTASLDRQSLSQGDINIHTYNLFRILNKI